MKLHVSGHFVIKGAVGDGFGEVVLDDTSAPQSADAIEAIRAACVAQIKDCGGFVIFGWHELPDVTEARPVVEGQSLAERVECALMMCRVRRVGIYAHDIDALLFAHRRLDAGARLVAAAGCSYRGSRAPRRAERG